MNSELAAEVAAALAEDFPAATPIDRQMRNALALSEEAGEAVGAIRRYLGLARCGGSLKEVMDELADTVLCAYIIAHFFEADLDAAIAGKVTTMFARGFTETRTCPHCDVDLLYLGGNGQVYSRGVGVEIRGVYDGVLFWACPDCHGTWNRWNSEREPRRWAAAEKHRQLFADNVTGKK